MKLPKTYEPSEYEPEIYALWEASGAFAPMDAKTREIAKKQGKGEPYSIVMPPPNANGNLHVGHAYMIPIEDILTRYYRMKGRDTVWLPGADHAGFETWVVFERALEKEGKSRFDFSREELYKMTWDFVEQNRGNMELQLRALGASCDWSALTFTLDKKVIETVYATFKKLWDDGLVYRGERIVNYCTHHQTSFADIEVVFREEKSHLWHIAYPLANGDGEIVVATTRPETMLGDVAIAVHPDDEKYRKLVGKKAKLLLSDREIPIIADEGVELDFGTGAVKITPAHDPLDFEIGARHNLQPIQIIGLDGKITDNAPEKYRGMNVDKARETVVKDLENLNLIREIKDFTHQVPHCYKCGTIIQPLMMKQWFVDVKPLAKRAKRAIENRKIKFTPIAKGKELAKYFDELRDWNISRQIPWGIPIPAFQNADDPDDWIFDTRVELREITVEGCKYLRDEDTFDTWFSSGQWPFITTDYLGGGDLSRFYPTSVMETGVDLLRQWVARMIMLGLYATGKVPFRDVFFHGLVLDEHGVKMSKSKGNVINPMDVIGEFGSDALRLGIVMNRSAGQAQAFSTASVVAGRNFANKLWNIARFVENVGGSTVPRGIIETKPQTPAEHWIFAKLDDARKKIDDHVANYRFAEAVETIYHVIWDDVADWFVEAAKNSSRPEFLYHVLNICLRLAHPFAPFVTETIWTSLRGDDTILVRETWPEKLEFDSRKAERFDQLREIVEEIRFVSADLPLKKRELYFAPNGGSHLVRENADLIKELAKLKDVRELDAIAQQKHPLKLAVNSVEIWLELTEKELYDHQAKLEERLLRERQDLAKLNSRLQNRGYVERAPKDLVTQTRYQIREIQNRITKLQTELGAGSDSEK